MKQSTKKLVAALLALVMLLGILAGCSTQGDNEAAPTEASGATEAAKPSADVSNYPIDPEELGSGDVKWSEETTADGWIEVTNTDGETLGYSPDSGVTLIQVEGYAFKDLNRNGKLDAYEDWRLDDDTRAADLAAQLPVETMTALFTHGGWSSFGSSLAEDMDYLEAGGRAGVTRSSGAEGSTEMAVIWTNLLQAYCETNGGFGIPATVSIDPAYMSGTIDANSIAASMDVDLALQVGQEQSKEYRAVGVTMLLGPQIDISTTPMWRRATSSYSEDPALNRDLGNAYISGLQSTYDENGNDLGWGSDSVISIVKHFGAAGAAEGGRNDHYDYGKYTVFPGNNFDAHLIPFLDGAFKLNSLTGSAAGIMPCYDIAYTEDGSLGELVGTAYSEYKMNLLRESGYGGFVLTDWGITSDGLFAMPWGVEDLTAAERFCLLYENGIDQVGGSLDLEASAEGYALMVEDWGEETALARLREAVTHFFITQLEVGLYENPYISTAYANATAWTEESIALGAEMQEQSVVMIKNTDNTIHEYDATAEKPTIYIPYTLTTSGNPITGFVTTCGPVANVDLASEYYNVVTDSVGEPSGENGSYTEDDIIRASAKDVAACDYALVVMVAPFVEGTTDEEGNYLPASLQYEQYTADSDAVRKEAIANGFTSVEFVDNYGVTRTQMVAENRSYYGNTAALPDSYGDYELLQYVSNAVSDDCKVIVVMRMTSCPAMVWSEVEPMADAILMYFGEALLDEDSLLNLVTGQVEPSGLLPMQQPASMEAVEAQLEDVPRDTECYVDANGNTYDFCFGMNWSGIINDERVATYSVAALTEPAG